MIAVTQGCLDNRLSPLGIVMAESKWLDTPCERLASLVAELTAKAPEGTTHLFNVTFQPKEYHGHHYLFGYADAYIDPDLPPALQQPQEGVLDADPAIPSASHWFG